MRTRPSISTTGRATAQIPTQGAGPYRRACVFAYSSFSTTGDIRRIQYANPLLQWTH